MITTIKILNLLLGYLLVKGSFAHSLNKSIILMSMPLSTLTGLIIIAPHPKTPKIKITTCISGQGQASFLVCSGQNLLEAVSCIGHLPDRKEQSHVWSIMLLRHSASALAHVNDPWNHPLFNS